MTQLIATNQLTLTNVNDGQPIKDNLFSATNFSSTKYANPTQPKVLVSWQYIGKPNTKYTLSTDAPKNVQGTYDIFFGVYPSTPSSLSNGVAINEPRTITSDATGIIEITARVGAIANSIIAKTSHLKLEENDRMTAFIFHPDDQIGDRGADGKTQYTHIAYADNATGGGFSQTDQTKAYIGMYQDFNATDSTNPTAYRWSKWKGSDGEQGIPGPKGDDGKTPYIHFAYSDNADGTGLTTSDNGQRYIGQYSDYTQADSTDKTKYRWADRWAKIEVGGKNYFSRSLSNYNPGGIYAYRKLPKNIITISVSDNDVNQDITGCYIGVTKNGYDLSGGGNWVVSKGILKTNKTTINGFGYLSIYPNKQDTIDKLFNRYKIKVETGTVATDWSLAPEDAQAEIDSKADQDKVVYKTDISVTDEGIVHSASKTVNGQTIASMISQRAEWVEIIANLLKVKGDMIVDGTIGANKLSVDTLSALAADLGQISGGSLELLKSEAQGASVDAWGNFTIPAHKWGLYIDNIGAISSGTPVRKSSSESTASDMPVAVLTSGQLRFARVDQNNDLGSVLHYGLSDPDNATISFAVASDGTKQLLIQANGQIVNQGTNYTGWTSTGVSGVYYKRQGDVVALKMQVTTTANQTYGLGKIPVSLLPIQNAGTMMRVTAWTADQGIGRNLQINSDGSMTLLASGRGDTFNTQVAWII